VFYLNKLNSVAMSAEFTILIISALFMFSTYCCKTRRVICTEDDSMRWFSRCGILQDNPYLEVQH